MIRSATVLIGFIISLSIIYYISFWGSFDVNIFQYLAATDIIKGVAYPLRFGVLVGVVVLVLCLLAYVFFLYNELKHSEHVDKEDLSEKRKGILVGFVMFAFGWFLFYFFDDHALVGLLLSVSLLLFIIVVEGFVGYGIKEMAADKSLVEEHKITYVLSVVKFLQAPILVFLLINALISGQVEANAIKSGKSYDYIATKDLPANLLKTNEKYLIFLGSAGDKYFFIDKTSNEHFVVDKTVLQVVKSFHFERDSKDAQAVFEHNIQ